MLILLAFLLLTLIHFSCEKCNGAACECDDFSGVVDFSIEKMGSRIITVNGIIPDSSMFYASDSIFLSVYIKKTQDIAYQMSKSLNFSFFKNAFACSPDPPKAIQNIVIVANSNMSFNNRHFNIGDTLNQFFELKNHYRNDFENISEFIKTQSFINIGEEFWFRFVGNTKGNNLELDLNVELTLSDGKVFDFRSQKIKVL